MSMEKRPQNFIPGLTIPQEMNESEAGTVNKDHVRESSAAQKLFVRAGLIGLLIPTPEALNDSAKQLLCANGNGIERRTRIERSHTIDVPPEKLLSTDKFDSRRATFGDIHKKQEITNTSSDLQHKERTVKELKKAHKIFSNNKLLVRGPSAYEKRKVISQRESSDNVDRNEIPKHTRLLDISYQDKRRSRSFSAGVDYIGRGVNEADSRPASTEMVRRKGVSVCSMPKGKSNDERKNMAEMQEVLRSKLPKTFQATACMALIGPAAVTEKRRYSHVKASTKNSASSVPLRERVNSIPWLKHMKSESPKGVKESSSTDNIHCLTSQTKELKHTHKTGRFKLFSKRGKSHSLDHTKHEQADKRDDLSKEDLLRVTSNMMYISRSSSLPVATVNVKSTRENKERDRLSSSSNDSGINIQVHEDSSSEEEIKKLKRKGQRSFKQIYLTPTEAQKRSSYQHEDNQLQTPSMSTERKISFGLRKMSLGKPPAVHRVSFKISEKFSLIKLSPSTEKSETKFYSLPKRPHSYLRGIRDDISKDLRPDYSKTLPTSRKHRIALTEELFQNNNIESIKDNLGNDRVPESDL